MNVLFVANDLQDQITLCAVDLRVERNRANVTSVRKCLISLEIYSHMGVHTGDKPYNFSPYFLFFSQSCHKRGAKFGALLWRHLTPQRTRSSADADNRLDAFSGQSRSTNIVPFHVIYSFLLCNTNLSLRRAVFTIFDFKNAATLKTGLGVRQGHWKCHHVIEHIGLSIDVL